jgi:putative ATPase
LALATLYLATAPKSNSTGAYWGALAEIEEHGAELAPIYLRDKSEVFRGSLREHYQRTMGDHDGYKYPHSHPDGWVEQRYLPEGVEGGWFRPKGYGYEREIVERLEKWRKREESGA